MTTWSFGKWTNSACRHIFIKGAGKFQLRGERED